MVYLSLVARKGRESAFGHGDTVPDGLPSGLEHRHLLKQIFTNYLSVVTMTKAVYKEPLTCATSRTLLHEYLPMQDSKHFGVFTLMVIFAKKSGHDRIARDGSEMAK